MGIVLKLALIVGGTAFWLYTQKQLGKRAEALAKSGHSGIYDLLHALTERHNGYFNRSPRAANFLLISSSLIVDALGIFLIAETLFGKTLEPFLGLLILFGLRQLNQASTILPVPKGMLWRDPGFPSLFVTYGVSQDLFFSGHTALAVYGALEIMKLGPLFLWLGLSVIAYEVTAVILLRAHWTMDVYAGAVSAYCVSVLVHAIAPRVDAILTSLPF